MDAMKPISFDIETDGFGFGAQVTVAGFYNELGAWICLNTGGHSADRSYIHEKITQQHNSEVKIKIVPSEELLLEEVAGFGENLNKDEYYLTAYNGEMWNGGFDLPFIRKACIKQDVRWPFPDMAYCDTMGMLNSVHTGDDSDLVGTYEKLIEEDDLDPFDSSEQAVSAYEEQDWLPLLLHNLSDIKRTYELASLAGKYVPRSDFGMKNLDPPESATHD